ncbi:MAG: DUF885 domain-containing protein [Isosphaeraceae bacterium]
MRTEVASLVFVVGLITAGPALGDEAHAKENSRLATFFQNYLDDWLRAEPLTATRLGDHRFDDRLDDLSVHARAARVERDRTTLAELTKLINPELLSRDSRIDFEILRHHLERSIWQYEHFRPFEDDPRVYGDYLSESVYLLFAQSTQPKERRLKNALARMARIPEVVKVARATIKNPPRVKTETAIRQAEGAISFYKDDLFTLAGQRPGAGELGEKAKTIITALESHLLFLKEVVLPRSNKDWRVGRELFVKTLDLELDSGISADEVLREAESEAERVEREMAVVARQLWGETFPSRVIPPDDPAGRREMTRKVLDALARNHGTPESLVSDARQTVQEIKDFITSRRILSLPVPDQCQVIEMPEFMRGNSVAYLNPSPPIDRQAVSEYAISPPPADWSPRRVASYLEEYNRSMLKILTIHEAYPGHYVQLAYSNRHPSLIRRVLSSGTFAEGWAVYTEQMMLDQGFGGGDLALRLHQLKFYLRAVVNAILDRKMHAEQLSDEQAMELLVGRAFQTEGEAVGKIIRSKQSSAQLSTYFVGRTAFYRLRRKVQRAQGDRFDLARYHETVLSHATLYGLENTLLHPEAATGMPQDYRP